MLRESELRALTELREPMAVSVLAERLDRSQSRVSEIASALEAKGLVRKERDGKAKRVAPTESKAIEMYHDLTQRFGATTPIEDAVAARTERVCRELELLRALDRGTAVGDLSDEIDASEDELSELLDDLEEKGAVRRHGDEIERLGKRPWLPFRVRPGTAGAVPSSRVSSAGRSADSR